MTAFKQFPTSHLLGLSFYWSRIPRGLSDDLGDVPTSPFPKGQEVRKDSRHASSMQVTSLLLLREWEIGEVHFERVQIDVECDCHRVNIVYIEDIKKKNTWDQGKINKEVELKTQKNKELISQSIKETKHILKYLSNCWGFFFNDSGQYWPRCSKILILTHCW